MEDRWDLFARLQDQVSDIGGRIKFIDTTMWHIGREFPDEPTIPEKHLLDAATELERLARHIRDTAVAIRRRAENRTEANARLDAWLASREREVA